MRLDERRADKPVAGFAVDADILEEVIVAQRQKALQGSAGRCAATVGLPEPPKKGGDVHESGTAGRSGAGREEGHDMPPGSVFSSISGRISHLTNEFFMPLS